MCVEDRKTHCAGYSFAPHLAVCVNPNPSLPGRVLVELATWKPFHLASWLHVRLCLQSALETECEEEEV